MKEKVLIFGSEGCIGKVLCAQLEQKGYHLIRVDSQYKPPTIFVDIALNMKALYNIIDTDIAFIYNVMGSFTGIYDCDFQNNYVASKNIMDVIIKKGIKVPVLFIGTTAEYGSMDSIHGVPPSEKNILMPYTINGFIKSLQSELIEFYNRIYDVDFRIARVSNVFSFELSPLLLIGKIIQKLSNIQKNKKIKLNNLSSYRNYLHVEDLVSGLILIMEKGISKNVYNVASDDEILIYKLVNFLVSLLNYDFNEVIEYDINGKRDNAISKINIDKIKQLNWYENYSILNSIILGEALFPVPSTFIHTL